MADEERRRAPRGDPDAELWRAIRDLQAEVHAVRELAGREVRASEIFRRLIVGLGDTTEHDHDTLVLMNDEERNLLRRGLTRFEVAEQRQQIAAERKAWHQTLWGRAAAFAGVLAVGLDFYRATTGH